jgi:FkbM family methyltransferase
MESADSMYPVPRDREDVPVTRTAGPEHHSVFRQFSRWEGRVPEGFIVNFLGAMTRVDFFEGYSELSRQYPSDRYLKTEYPAFDEEYFEWIDILEAVSGAEGHFTMLELGAGFGRWTANAALALRRLKNLPHTLIAVEAEPTHFEWLTQHLADNLLNPKNLRLVRAAVAVSDGIVGFHVGEPANWYGQYIGGSHPVEAVSLKSLLGPLKSVDLVDMDIQGAELEVLEAAAQDLDEKVKRVHVGTHGAEIEQGLHQVFTLLGWKCLRSFPCGGTVETEWGRIRFQDGVQTWLNPAYSDRQANDWGTIRNELEAARRKAVSLWTELKQTREERDQQRARVVALEQSIGLGMILRARRVRERIAPFGTKRRALLDSIAREIFGPSQSESSKNPPAGPPAYPHADWNRPYETLRKKWVEVPVTLVGAYEANMAQNKSAGHNHEGNGEKSRFLSWEIVQANGGSEHTIEGFGAVTVNFRIEVHQAVRNAHHGIGLYDHDRQLIWGNVTLNVSLGPGIHDFCYQFPMLPLRPGPYTWLVSLWEEGVQLDAWNCIPNMMVTSPPLAHPRDEWAGPLNIPSKFEIKCAEARKPAKK